MVPFIKGERRVKGGLDSEETCHLQVIFAGPSDLAANSEISTASNPTHLTAQDNVDKSLAQVLETCYGGLVYKESVRKASESSLRALTKTCNTSELNGLQDVDPALLLQACVRTCDAQAKGREHALGVIIPSVAKGLSSSVAEARHTRYRLHSVLSLHILS
ncbi:hypothetical protein HPB51_008938 [Rhipicephalus microplus]|uniref:Uncharacterized protein n=1 Tax=Rhipicephalus microplus TaxID=6941 RepID=A0A9J6D4M4_RHIMP|nr:hypothetical protein HPB51_008938 [Rhipicephalus microplus]